MHLTVLESSPVVVLDLIGWRRGSDRHSSERRWLHDAHTKLQGGKRPECCERSKMARLPSSGNVNT